MIARELDKDTLNENVSKVHKNCGATAAARQQQDHLRLIFVSFLLRTASFALSYCHVFTYSEKPRRESSDKGAAWQRFRIIRARQLLVQVVRTWDYLGLREGVRYNGVSISLTETSDGWRTARTQL